MRRARCDWSFPVAGAADHRKSSRLFGRRLQFLPLTTEPRLQCLPLTALITESYPALILGRTAHSMCGRIERCPPTWRSPFPYVSLLACLQRGIRWSQLHDCPAVMGIQDVRQRGVKKICCHRAESWPNSWPHRQTRFASSLDCDHRFPGMKLHTCVEEDNSISLPPLYSVQC